MILKRIPVRVRGRFSVTIPYGSWPVRFMNQGTQGVYLWYHDSGNTEDQWTHEFWAIEIGGEVPPEEEGWYIFQDDFQKGSNKIIYAKQ